MDITKYIDIFTTHQINTTILALALIALLISGVFLYYTNDIKTTAITFLSVLLTPMLTAILLLILYEYFDIHPSEKHTIILWSALFINTINLSTLIGRYSKEVVKKDFDIENVKGHHFTATLNLFAAVLLTTLAVSAFVELNMTIIMLSTLLISSINIWFNHTMARILLKNQ